jgi:DNA-binding transcriptional ArsR family regulator
MNAVFKALADPTRRKVLELLRQRPMTAGELAEHFPVSRPTMSAHFAVLREADLIEASKIGTTITYQLKLSVLEDALLGFARLLGVDAREPVMADADEKTEAEPTCEGATE